MDTSVTPVPGDFMLMVDLAAKVPDSIAWPSSTVLELEYTEALLNPTAVTLQLLAATPNFRSPQHFIVQPFFFVGVEI